MGGLLFKLEAEKRSPVTRGKGFGSLDERGGPQKGRIIFNCPMLPKNFSGKRNIWRGTLSEDYAFVDPASVLGRY